MIIIKEIKKANLSIYEYVITENNKTILRKHIIILAKRVLYNGLSYFIIYDENYIPVDEIFDYLNYGIYEQSNNSKLQNMEALKFLICFQNIIGKKLEDFDALDFSLFKSFLRGENQNGSTIKLELVTTRTSSTINAYLSCIRSFAKYIGINCKPLFEKSSFTAYEKLSTIYRKESDGYTFSTKSYGTSKFAVDEKVQYADEVPAYISLQEYIKIISIVRKHFSLRSEIIIRLLYESGMRIGEVFGLTAEDIRMDKIGNRYMPTVYIRNRFTDINSQNAKTCMKIHTRKEYKRVEYTQEGFGYQVVYISKELYELIDIYIESEHLIAREKHKKEYYEFTVADRVGNYEEDINYYVFINSKGKPLVSQLWNRELKEIFKKADIIIDIGKREKNLNHRFRHGYAMFQVQHMNITDLETLRIRMRHKHISSVKCYLKYTHEDKVKIKQNFTKQLYEIAPELKQLICFYK